jgi:hypothetical protein
MCITPAITDAAGMVVTMTGTIMAAAVTAAMVVTRR